MNTSAYGNIRLREMWVSIRILLLLINRTYRSKEMMKTLVAKYPEGYEGWAEENGETPVEKSYAKV